MLETLHSQTRTLWRYAFALSRNHADADDLVQETLAKAIASADSFRAGGDLRAWLFGILHNTFVSDQRKSARRARALSFLENTAAEADSPSEQERHVEADRTLRLLGRLSPDQQSALVLIAIEGMSYEKAAESLGIPAGTLMSRLARGREQLRRLVHNDRSRPLRVVR